MSFDKLTLPLAGLTAKKLLTTEHSVNWLCRRLNSLQPKQQDLFLVVICGTDFSMKFTRL